MSMSENPKEYRVLGGSHDGEVFQDKSADVKEKGKLTQVSMPHRTDATLREIYERTFDDDGAPILRHTTTHAADMPSSPSLTMTRRTKSDGERD